MKTYKSPVYPALMVRLPGEGRRSVKAAGGYFNVEDDDVPAFEALMAKRPHYRIREVHADLGRQIGGQADETGTVAPAPESDVDDEIDAADDAADAADADGSEHGIVVQADGVTDVERHPEMVSIEMLEALNVPTLRARLEERGLPTDGRKAVLVKRLADATNTPTGLGDNVTDDPDGDEPDDE